MRKLAHVEKIIDIQPILNADKIEVATVLGWKVVIKKDEFKVGDKIIYIEIDSRVPKDEPYFSFLADRNYKVKSIKLRKQVSQGLIVPMSLLPEGDYKEGDDVTDILKITKIEEDYKQPPVNKELQLKQRHKKLYNKKWFKYMMKYAWFRKLAFKFLLPKKRKTSWPSWITKTDEERVQNMPWILEDKSPFFCTEKCVSGDMLVRTIDGYDRISNIVNEKKETLVASLNTNTGRIEYKKILAYHKVLQSDNKNHYKIQVGHRGKGNRAKYIKCTEDHKLLTNKGWVEAQNLQIGDTVYHYTNKFPNEILEMILGALLGDSSLVLKDAYMNIQFGHSENQYDYLLYKHRLLGCYATNIKEYESGYGSTIFRFMTKTNLDMYNFIMKNCVRNGKKTITKEWCNNLTPMSLAIWYMDDGSIENREDDSLSEKIMLNTQAYTEDECNMLRNMLLQKYNIETKLGDPKVYKGYTIILNSKASEKFFSIIAPYVCASMKYKLPKKYESLSCPFENGFSFDFYDGVTETTILGIEKCPPKSLGKYMYDIEVEDNHNYFTQSICVHNCDGTSSTYSLHKEGNKWRFYVCSRNVVQETPDHKNYYEDLGNVYWEMAKKYDIENKLRAAAKEYNVKNYITLQGEIIGEGIQKNKYELKGRDLYLFNLIVDDVKYNPVQVAAFALSCDMKAVPILATDYVLPDTVDELMEFATGNSTLHNTLREGIVFRSHDMNTSFKCVSNKFLLKWGL